MDYLKMNEEELIEYYCTYFDDKDEVSFFIKRAFELQDIDNRVSIQMLNQIKRFCTLAKRIDEIYQPRDGLRILFIKICMEALSFLAYGKEDKKRFYKEFSQCFSAEAESTIGEKIHYSYYEGSAIMDYNEHYNCSVDDLLEIIRITRNKVVHDGDFWSVQIFSTDENDDANWLCDIDTDDKIDLFGIEKKKGENISIHFQTRMGFETFLNYFIEACIKYVDLHMDSVEKKYKTNKENVDKNKKSPIS